MKSFGDTVLIVVLALGAPFVAVSAMYHLHEFYIYNLTTIPCGKDDALRCRPVRR